MALLRSASFGALALALLAATAPAQTRSTAVVVGVSNTDFADQGLLVSTTFQSDSEVPFTSGGATTSYDGLDRGGNEATMTFNGNGSGASEFGRLRTFTDITVTNAFYNSDNEPFVNSITGEINSEGTPDFLESFAAARFTDTLQYGGTLQSGYGARYIFAITGTVSGNARNSAAIQTQIAGNEPEEETFNYGTNGPVFSRYATQTYAINGTTPQEIFVAFGSATTAFTQDFPDGTTIFGTGEFRSTAVLTAIEITDATGNLVSGVTVTSASGTAYPVASPVPEPATLAALTLGGLGFLARRRRTAR